MRDIILNLTGNCPMFSGERYSVGILSVLLFLLCLSAPVGEAFAREGIDTSGYDGTYNVGDVIGGSPVVRVIHLNHSNLPGLQPGRNTTTGGTSQSGWDVYVLDSNITLTIGDASLVEFRRNDINSVAPRKVIFDFQDHTLTANYVGGQSRPLFRLAAVGGGPSTTGGVSDSIIIKNGTVVHNLTNRYHGEDLSFEIQNVRWIDFINLKVKINEAHETDPNAYSVGGIAFYGNDGGRSNADYGNYQIYFDNIHIWNYSTAFYRRDRVFASGMSMGGTHRKDSMSVLFGITTDQDWYHYTIKNTVIHKTPHFGFYLSGSLDVNNNTCSTAARNDYYEYYEGGSSPTITGLASASYPFPDASFPNDGQWPNVPLGLAYGAGGQNGWHQMWTSDNSYAFAFSDGRETTPGAGPGSKIHHNTVVHIPVSGAYHGAGNRGFAIEHPYGTASEPILIHNNTIEVGQGRSGTFVNGTVWGIRVRWGGQHVKIYDNDITALVDSRDNDGTAEGQIPSSVGSIVYGIRWTAMAEANSGVAENISIYNNRFTTVYNNDAVFGQSGVSIIDYGIAFDNRLASSPSTNKIYGNHLQVRHAGILAGGFGTDGPTHSMIFYNDTIVRGSPYDTSGWRSIRMGYGDLRADTNVTFLDVVYQGGADESDIFINRSGQDYWRWARSVRVLVVGNGTPPFVGVPSSAVTVTNGYSQALASIETVDNNAIWSDTIFYERRGHESFVDSLSFNPHTFTASKSSDVSTPRTVTIDSDRNSVVLVLNSTAGSIDTTGWQGAIITGSVTNTAPTTPSPTSPTGSSTVSTSPILVCGASTDPESSSLTYTYQVSKFQNFSSIAATGSVVSSSSSTVSWQVAPALESQASYWWRVKASDFLESSSWSSGSAFVTDIAVNSAPSSPGISSPPNGSSIAQTSVSLVLVNSSDVDGDQLTYDFELYNSSGSTLLDSRSGVAAGLGTSLWATSFSLSDGVSYTWRVRAFDGADYSSWSSTASFSVSVGSGNTPPSIPIGVTPASGDTLIGSSVTFTWQNSFDPDGDDVGYDVWIVSDSIGGADIDSARNVAEASTGTTTSRAFSTSLTDGRKYWWSIRANDAQAWTARSVPKSFVQIGLITGAGDGTASPDSPANGSVVKSSRPTLVTNNSSASGSNVYYFELATDSFFVSTVALSGALPEGANNKTAWTLDTALQTSTVYYWRVKANSDAFSAVSSFTVQPIPHASPVPFRPAVHAAITFHDLPSGANLVIITLNGETVWRTNNIVGGTAIWDGANSSGSTVASGVYLWFIEGSNMKGKLVVQR